MTNSGVHQSSSAVGHVKNQGIQFLRAVAVLSVITFHLNHTFLPGGFVGVDVFFVISGFVITQSLMRNWKANLLSFLIQFYTRRILRIAPALLVFIAVVSLLIALFVPRGFFLGGDGPETGMWAVFGLSNFSLYFADRGYFDERIEFNAFSHTWSLGVEEQFYLVLPIVFWAILTATARYSYTLKNRLVLIFLSIPVVLSLGVAASTSGSDPLSAFYLLPSRFWELGVGVVLAVVINQFKYLKALKKGPSWALLGLGAALLVFAIVATDRQGFPFPGALAPVVATALLIVYFGAAFNGASGKAQRLIGWGPVQVIGNWSYSLYLWHWGVIVLLRWTLGLEYWWHYLMAVVATFSLAGLSYHFIEQPFLRLGRTAKLPSAKVLIGALTASTLWLGALWAGDRAAEPLLSQSVTAHRTVFSPPEGTPDPKDEYSSLAGVGEGHKIFIIGDSHAGHFGTLLTELRAVMHFEFTVLDDRSCRVAPLTRPRGECDDWLDVVERVQNESKPGDIVLLSSLRIPRLSSLVNGQQESTTEIIDQYLVEIASYDRAELLRESQEAVAALRAGGAIVVIPTPTPVFPAPVFRCLDWFNSVNPVCDGGFAVAAFEMERASAPAKSIIATLEQERVATAWDIFSVLCPDQICEAQRGGRYVVYDGDHLSAWGNYMVMPGFVELLKNQWESPQGEG